MWPLVSLSDAKLYTLPIVLAIISRTFGSFANYRAMMAGALMASIPPVLVYILFQRNFIRGISLTGMKG